MSCTTRRSTRSFATCERQKTLAEYFHYHHTCEESTTRLRIGESGEKYAELQIPGSLSVEEAQETLNSYETCSEHLEELQGRIKALQVVISVMAGKLDAWHSLYPSEDWRSDLRNICLDEHSVFVVSPGKNCEAFFLPKERSEE